MRNLHGEESVSVENKRVVIIPDGTVEIADGEFAFREDICEVRLPETVRRIGKSAFQECVNLAVINFPNRLEEIDDAAFCNCLSLTEPSTEERVRVGVLAFHHTKKK